MDLIYFVSFCLGIAYVIFWCFRNDDQAEFMGQEHGKKFSTKKRTEDSDVNSPQ